jgi:ABC-type Fe3+ transport system permease subunit
VFAQCLPPGALKPNRSQALASTRRVCTFFVLTKGAKAAIQSENDDWTVAKSAWVSAVVAVGFGVLCGAIAVPVLIHRSNKKFNE